MTATLALSFQNCLYNNLNDEQRIAVDHYNGPLLVAAGAGAGKTGVLTRRIAKLLVTNEVDPYTLLISTFTVKAANEMKERLAELLYEAFAIDNHGKTFTDLGGKLQHDIKQEVQVNIINKMMIGTLHRCFGQILRTHIDYYKDPEGFRWTKRYAIVDPSDQMKMIRHIITKTLQLDPQYYSPKSVASSISRMKNGNIMPDDMNIPSGITGYGRRKLNQIYREYRKNLANENALDFDDMLMITARLLQQNADIRRHWHQRFRHILVDEYQDTNQCQFDVLRMIVFGDTTNPKKLDWNERSFFVVGDIDQAIYSFRGADYQIMLNFQQDFGDGIMTKDSQTMILLEKNYRSTNTIIQAANSLIANNSLRVDKVLEATRDKGAPILFKQFTSEDREAIWIANEIKTKIANDECNYKDIAVIYRNNSISRALESEFVRHNIPHIMLKGIRFFERREIKDLLGYLQFLDDPSSDASLLRVINTPKRGIGNTTLDKIKLYAHANDMCMWDVLSNADHLKNAIKRSNTGIQAFTSLIQGLKEFQAEHSLEDLLREIADRIHYSDYIDAISSHPDDASDRKTNVFELFAAVREHTQQANDHSIQGFLEAAALQLEAGSNSNDSNAVTLMTIHASKGLEYNQVILAGAEDNVIPSYRTLQTEDQEMLEEERRLFYVAMTRAKNALTITAATLRSNARGEQYPNSPSMFLFEIPQDYIAGDIARLF